MTTIKTKKFILRPYRKGDEQEMLKHINDKDISKNTFLIPYPYTMKDAKDWVRKNVEQNKKGKKGNLIFAIEIDGEVCGTIGLTKIEDGHKAEIAYWLGRTHWGKGFMTEIVKKVTNYAFRELKLRRVYGQVFLFNESSKKVLEKAGFELEGISKKDAKKGNKYLDVYILAKVR